MFHSNQGSTLLYPSKKRLYLNFIQNLVNKGHSARSSILLLTWNTISINYSISILQMVMQLWLPQLKNLKKKLERVGKVQNLRIQEWQLCQAMFLRWDYLKDLRLKAE